MIMERYDVESILAVFSFHSEIVPGFPFGGPQQLNCLVNGAF